MFNRHDLLAGAICTDKTRQFCLIQLQNQPQCVNILYDINILNQITMKKLSLILTLLLFGFCCFSQILEISKRKTSIKHSDSFSFNL